MTESLLDTPAAPPSDAPPATGSEPPGDNSDWRASLPEDVRSLSTLGEFKTLGDALKGYDALSRKMGGGPDSVIAIPKDDEGWNGLYSKLGRPENPDGYELDAVSGLDVLKDELPVLREAAHKAGLTDRQAKALFGELAQMESAADEAYTKEATEAQAKASAEAKTALQTEWGDKFTEKLTLANRAASEVFGDALEAVKQSGLGDNPAFLKGLARIGVEMFAEDKAAAGGSADGGGVNENPLEYLMKTDPEWKKAYEDANNPDHATAMTRLENAYAKRYGTEPVMG